MNAERAIGWGSILAGLAVAAGAFGAHGLKTVLAADDLAIWEIAVRYQMYHALGLILAGVLGVADRTRSVRGTAWCFLVGIGVFCGLLYALALTQLKILGAIVPIGGVAFILGWVLLAWSWAGGVSAGAIGPRQKEQS